MRWLTPFVVVSLTLTAAAADKFPAAKGDIEITPLIHSSVQIEYGGTVIQVDPWSVGDLSRAKPADLILVTDDVGHHLDVKAIARLRKPGAPVVIAANGRTGVPDGIVLANGESRVVAGVPVEAVAAYDIKPGAPEHPKGEANGYVVTLGGRRLYFAGVTECVPEVKALERIDVAFMPMNIPVERMTPAAAAECTKALKPKVVYVYHYDQDFASRAVNPNARAQGIPGGLTVAQSLEAFRAAMQGEPTEVRLGAWYPPAQPPPEGDMSASIVQSEFVYETAPFASAHASTIVEANGALVAAWFGGTREGASDVGIWLSRRLGRTWSPPVEVATGVQTDGTRYPCWNPVLFELPDRTLALFYKVGPSPREWWGMMRTSRGSGSAWSDARRLPDGILGPIKNKPVRIADGSVLAPSSTESAAPDNAWRVHFERTNDLGVTWTTAQPAAPADNTRIDAIQPSILVHPGGRLQAIGRSRAGRIFETWSDDGGRTWSPLTLTALPNPNSGIDAVTLRDGRHLVVYNHTPRGRSPLNVAVSRDGRVWDAALVLERDPGEYSYPAVIQSADGLVHVTYTWRRQRIRHVVIDPAKITAVPMKEGQWPM